MSTDPSPARAPRHAAEGATSTARLQVRAQTLLVADGVHAPSRLVVVDNGGPGPAHHVLVRLVRSLGTGAPLALEEVPSVDRLPAQSRLVVRVLAPAPDAARALEVAVVWSDGAGRHELVRQLAYAGA